MSFLSSDGADKLSKSQLWQGFKNMVDDYIPQYQIHTHVEWSTPKETMGLRLRALHFALITQQKAPYFMISELKKATNRHLRKVYRVYAGEMIIGPLPRVTTRSEALGLVVQVLDRTWEIIREEDKLIRLDTRNRHKFTVEE